MKEVVSIDWAIIRKFYGIVVTNYVERIYGVELKVLVNFNDAVTG